MRNRTCGGVRGRKTKVGRKLLRFPPTRSLFSIVMLFHCLMPASRIADKMPKMNKNEPDIPKMLNY